MANRISVPYFWGWFLLCSSEDLMQPTGGCVMIDAGRL